MRVLVCGGRAFNDYEFIKETLQDILADYDQASLFIIEGAGPGVARQPSCDEMVFRWRINNELAGARFPVDYALDGPWPGAGPRRNARMLKEGRPDMGIAFPGGRGTADMVRRMKAAGVPVREIVKLR